MKKSEYVEYQERVANFFVNEGINCCCAKSNEDCEGGINEPYTSSCMCDCCEDTQQGDRIDAHGFNPTTKEIQEYSICTDCEYYLEYGQLSDQVMLDMTDD